MRTLILMTVVFFLIASGCTKKSASSASGSYLAIDGNIGISPMETLDSTGTGRHLNLICTTSKIYSCCNYPLIYSLSRSGNTFTITFKYVLKEEWCLTSLGPASTTIDLGVLPDNNYKLKISTGSIISNECDLAVSDEAYIISHKTGSSIIYPHDTLLRVSGNTVWGYVCYDSTGSYSALLAGFMDSLVHYGVESVPFSAGYYHYFELLPGNAFPHNSGCSYSTQFIYKYTGDLTVLKNLVWHYWSLSDSTFYINIHTDKGYNYMSWYQH
jgi:hypothetical protein